MNPRVIRETLARILGRDFSVVKRPLGSTGIPLADVNEQVDLLILTTSSTLIIENLDGAAPDAQALLVKLLDQKEEKFLRVLLAKATRRAKLRPIGTGRSRNRNCDR